MIEWHLTPEMARARVKEFDREASKRHLRAQARASRPSRLGGRIVALWRNLGKMRWSPTPRARGADA